MRSALIAAVSVAVIILILLLQVFLVGGSDQVDLEGFENEKNHFISESISSEYRYEVSEPAKTDYGPSNSSTPTTTTAMKRTKPAISNYISTHEIALTRTGGFLGL